MHKVLELGSRHVSYECIWSSKGNKVTSVLMARERALVTGPLGACGVDDAW